MQAAPGRSSRRRHVVIAAVLAVVVLVSVGAVYLVRPTRSRARVERRSSSAQANPIVAENQKPGTRAWRIERPAGSALEGYASATSVAPGEPVVVYASSRYPTFAADVYRMGWYDGLGGRSVVSFAAVHGDRQPAPSVDPQTKMVEARWSPTFTIRVGKGWTTGVYLVKLTAPDGVSSYVPFTVREGAHRAPFVFQSSVTTWEAYNGWGGHSLYTGLEDNGDKSARLRSTVVSFDRPYATGAGAGDFFYMEFPLLRWLEEQGYDLGYVTSIDTHTDAGLLAGRRAFLSMGHDEYWSTPMRTHVSSAIASGVNFAFLGANAIFRHIRLESSPLGGDRREVNYRSATADPITATDPSESTVQWRDPPVNRPEDAILGAMYECNPVHDDAVVYDPLPSLFAGTGLRIGDHIRGLIGREYDRMFHNPKPPSRTWVLFRSPVHCAGAASVADTTLTQFPSGALVFDASTQGFVCAFGDCSTAPADDRVQRLVRNLLDAYLGRLSLGLDHAPRPFTIAPPQRQIEQRTEQRAPEQQAPPASGVREPSTPAPPRMPGP